MAFVILSGTRRWWVFGWQYKELKERYDKLEDSNMIWQQVAMRGVNISEKLVQTAQPDESAK